MNGFQCQYIYSGWNKGAIHTSNILSSFGRQPFLDVLSNLESSNNEKPRYIIYENGLFPSIQIWFLWIVRAWLFFFKNATCNKRYVIFKIWFLKDLNSICQYKTHTILFMLFNFFLSNPKFTLCVKQINIVFWSLS